MKIARTPLSGQRVFDFLASFALPFCACSSAGAMVPRALRKTRTQRGGPAEIGFGEPRRRSRGWNSLLGSRSRIDAARPGRTFSPQTWTQRWVQQARVYPFRTLYSSYSVKVATRREFDVSAGFL